MKNLKINLQKEVNESYEIEFVNDSSIALSDFLLEKKYNKILIISDTNVYPLHFDTLISKIDQSIQIESLKLVSGEEFKNMDAILKICSTLIEHKFNRNDCIVAFGGGVIGDMVGFAGSIFKRGMNVIQIPTTLLSMFDSSVGGKTGIDFQNIKNIIGNFKQPKRVLIDSNYLKTLPKEEVLSGYFEGLKHSLLKSREYYENFKHNADKLFEQDIKIDELNKIIEHNVGIKAEIVMKDEQEMGVRKLLNYGHTFGHAIEGATNFSFSHGVCVGFGMIYVNILSKKLGFLSIDDTNDINELIIEKLGDNMGKLSSHKLDFENLYSKMANDKKNIDINISFTLLDRPGKLHIEKIGDDNKSLLKECFKEFRGI